MALKKIKKQELSEELLFNTIIEAIKSKKGKEIVSIDLRKIENSVCEFFIICTGDSSSQTTAIADEVKDKTRELANAHVDHVEGMKNSNWILLDYISIVVHVFLPDQRKFYHLEDLWADGVLTMHEDV